MTFLPPARVLLLGSLVFALHLPSGRALLNIDGARNQLFVFGSVGYVYSSNLYSEATGRGDYSVNASVGMDLKRRAGIIAVNSTFKVDYQRFGKYTHENAVNPSFLLELNKTTGRTTGAFTLSAYRETRSDSAVNLRTSSWNLPVELNLKYPVNDNLYVTSGTSTLQRRYRDTAVLSNYTDYAEAIDAFYVYTSKLDLLGGYRLRVTQTARGADSTDHWFSIGATGGLYAKLNGTLRLGYQIRTEQGSRENFSQVNALAALAWPITRKFTLSSQISRDFNTIATGASVDSSNATLRAIYAFSRKLEFASGVGYGRNLFLGRTLARRRDDVFSWDLGATYRFSEHLSLAASYSYFRNWSSSSFSDFDRQGLSFTLASRY